MNDHSPEPSASRSGWAGILQPGRLLKLRLLLWCALCVAILMMASPFAWGFVRGFGPYGGGPLALVPYGFTLLVVLLLYLGAVYFIEKRTPRELALGRLLPELAAGALLGAVLFAVLMGVLVSAGAYALTGPTAAPVWRQFGDALKSGVVEELIFRGVILRLVWIGFGIWWALAVSSVSFGLVHLINPDTDIKVALMLSVEAGLLLGGLYALTRRLWAPMGCHIAWNFSEGYIFGAQVSGVGLGPSLYRAEPITGAGELWTGGMFGPEASLPSLLLLSSAGAVLVAAAWRIYRPSSPGLASAAERAGDGAT